MAEVVEQSRDVIKLACRVAYSKDPDLRAMMQLYDSDIVTAADTLRKVAKISQVDLDATIQRRL